LQEWLNFVGTELDKGLSSLINPDMSEHAKMLAVSRTVLRLNCVEAEFARSTWLLCDAHSVADGYLFAVVLAAKRLGIDLTGMPKLRAWYERMIDRPAVQLTLRAEGLITSK
jgi:glutathione S-transferase